MLKKRVLIYLVALLLTITSVTAQESFNPGFMAGVTGGVNLSNLIFQPKVDQGLMIGYDAGVVLRYDAISFAGIWLELDYSVRGWKEKPEEYPDLSYTRTLSFINMPVMTHFMIGKGPLKVTVDAGAHFGYLIAERSQSNFPQEPIPGTIIAQHDMPVENKFAWGIGGGVGVEYHMMKYIAGLRASYVYGLGEIYNNTRKDYFGKSSEQIVALKVYLLYKF